MTAVTGYSSGSDAGGDALPSTYDTIFGGRVHVEQPSRGYRVNVDALLLASFARAKTPAPLAFDLGAGVGAVAMSLLHLGAAERAVLVEIDRATAAMAERNVEANGWSDRADVLCGDVLDVARAHRAEARLVVCNPPYTEPGRGRIAKDAARARARSGSLARFVEAARTIAGRRARVCFVYPARELVTLVATMRGAGLEPKRLRMVHASESAPARVALVEAVAAKPGGLVVVRPFVERVAGRDSEELAALLGRASTPD